MGDFAQKGRKCWEKLRGRLLQYHGQMGPPPGRRTRLPAPEQGRTSNVVNRHFESSLNTRDLALTLGRGLRRPIRWRSLFRLGMASSKISTAAHFVTTRPQAPMKSAGNGVAWVPNMDVFAHEDGVVVKAELAGIRREDLKLTVEGNRLRIQGIRRDTPRAPGSRFLMMEIEYGAFEAAVELPSGLDMSSARAVYLNGFLRIEFGRAGKATEGPQRIEVA